MELYKVCLDLIHSYARSNTGKYRRTGLGPDEEESCEDLLQFLKMMTHLTVKDYINSGSPHGQLLSLSHPPYPAKQAYLYHRT